MASFAIARIRAQEETFRSREANLKEDSKTNFMARWEEKNIRMKNRRQHNLETEEKFESNKKKINKRHQKIKDLYEEEISKWRALVVESQYVSTETRIDQLRQKAYHLRAKRENERKEYVKACFDRQWRDACDEARSLDSKARLEKLVYDRSHAVVCKETKLKEMREDAKKSEEFHQKLRKLEEKERKDYDERRRKNIEIKIALDHQVKSLESKKERLKKQKCDEDSEQIAQWERENEQLNRRNMEMIGQAHKRGTEMLHENIARSKEMAKEKALQREKDLFLLKFAQEKERKQIEMELMKKGEGKEMAQEYVKYLREQMIKDKADESEVEAIRKTAMEEIWNKRESLINAEKEARKRLMKEVNEGRMYQIKSKGKEHENENIKCLEQAALDKEKWRQQELSEKKEHEMAKARIVENMEINKRLISIKTSKKAQENQEKYLLNKQIKHTERVRQGRLNQLSGNVQNYFPLKHTSWYS